MDGQTLAEMQKGLFSVARGALRRSIVAYMTRASAPSVQGKFAVWQVKHVVSDEVRRDRSQTRPLASLYCTRIPLRYRSVHDLSGLHFTDGIAQYIVYPRERTLIHATTCG